MAVKEYSCGASQLITQVRERHYGQSRHLAYKGL